jgi:PleD family two-component response regulator
LSIGLAELGTGESLEQVIDRADGEMYNRWRARRARGLAGAS